MPTALITGARRGIGWAIAQRLRDAGWTVFAGVRDDEAMARIAADGRGITPVHLDITDPDDIAALDSSLPARLDALINNAGIGVLGAIEAVSVPDFRRQFEVNLFGQIAVTQALLPRLRAAEGRIVFISSTGGRSVVPMEGAYCSSKFALEGVADALRVELRPWRIKVAVVEPGPTDTETWREIETMLADMTGRMTDEQAALYSRHVDGLRANIGRFASVTTPPDAVARAVERALTARRPKVRYPVGAPAKMMMVMATLLPARVGDAISARIAGLS